MESDQKGSRNSCGFRILAAAQSVMILAALYPMPPTPKLWDLDESLADKYLLNLRLHRACLAKVCLGKICLGREQVRKEQGRHCVKKSAGPLKRIEEAESISRRNQIPPESLNSSAKLKHGEAPGLHEEVLI